MKRKKKKTSIETDVSKRVRCFVFFILFYFILYSSGTFICVSSRECEQGSASWQRARAFALSEPFANRPTVVR